MGERQRVAVVGSGIAGLSAAYHIAKHGGDRVDVTLFEKVRVCVRACVRAVVCVERRARGCLHAVSGQSTHIHVCSCRHPLAWHGLGKRHVQGVQRDASGGPCERVPAVAMWRRMSTYCQHVLMLTAGMLLVVCARTSLKLTCPLYARSRDATHPPARCDMRTIAE
jgi:hypothetical protein